MVNISNGMTTSAFCFYVQRLKRAITENFDILYLMLVAELRIKAPTHFCPETSRAEFLPVALSNSKVPNSERISMTSSERFIIY